MKNLVTAQANLGLGPFERLDQKAKDLLARRPTDFVELPNHIQRRYEQLSGARVLTFRKLTVDEENKKEDVIWKRALRKSWLKQEKARRTMREISRIEAIKPERNFECREMAIKIATREQKEYDAFLNER